MCKHVMVGLAVMNGSPGGERQKKQTSCPPALVKGGMERKERKRKEEEKFGKIPLWFSCSSGVKAVVVMMMVEEELWLGLNFSVLSPLLFFRYHNIHYPLIIIALVFVLLPLSCCWGVCVCVCVRFFFFLVFFFFPVVFLAALGLGRVHAPWGSTQRGRGEDKGTTDYLRIYYICFGWVCLIRFENIGLVGNGAGLVIALVWKLERGRKSR